MPHGNGHFAVSGRLKSIVKPRILEMQLTLYASYDMFCAGSCLVGDTMIVPVLKFLVILIF